MFSPLALSGPRYYPSLWPTNRRREGACLNRLTKQIIGAAIEVHRALGPGLLESTYEECLAIELEDHGVGFQRQSLLPIRYRGRVVANAYRIDLLVQDTVIVELKSVEKVTPVHRAQILTYLRLANKPLGLLINFNVKVLREGVYRHYNPAFGELCKI